MSTIRGLYERFRQLIHEGAKFLVVGLIGTIVTFGVANALRHSVGEYAAITIATVLATVITFLGNGWWAFRSRQGQGTGRDSVIFFVLNGIGLLIYYACIWLIKDVAGLTGALWYNVELVVGTGLGTLFRFWSYRKWVWTAAEAPEEPVLSHGESAEDRAQDLAAVVGAAPAHHETAARESTAAAASEGAVRRTPASHRRTS